VSASTEAGRGPAALRHLPYPYRAALTITGDLDDLRSYVAFQTLTRFLCTGDDTPLGRGLSLELSHSFWFYDPTGECEFTVFDSESGAPGPHAQTIERLIRSGHIDVMHTYGNFSDGGFTREHAQRALSFLKERALTVPVWVNHGGKLNTQMVGSLPEQRGDDPGAPEYHTDLMVECGVRFVEMFEVVHTVGQDVRATPKDALVMAAEAARYLAAGDRFRARRSLRNDLLSACALGDGRRVYCFKRFIGRERGLSRAGGPELARQLSPPVLDELCRKRGWMSVYTHPWRNPGSDEILFAGAATALRGLAERSASGEILVTTTARLLRLNAVLKGLVWSSERSGGTSVVRIEGVRDAVLGWWDPTPAELSGVTFYVPDPDSVRVLLDGDEVDVLVPNAPDERGLASISFPLRRLGPPPL